MSALTIAVNTSTAGTATYTASETNDSPVFADDLTINSGVTVSVTAGDLNLRAGDEILLAGSASSSNLLDLIAGFGDLDGDGSISQTGGSLTAPLLSVQAIGGIALTGSNAVGSLEAVTQTGGIFINNTGNLAVGGVNPALAGVRVTGASGDIVLMETGNLTVTTDGEVIRGPANILLNASGDITTGNQSGSSAIFSTGAGDVSVTAGGNLNLGTAGTFGDVGANNGTVTLAATAGNVTLDNATNVFVNSIGNAINITAGGNITLQATTTPGANIDSNGGPISLTTGAAGVFTLNSGAGGHIGSGPFYSAPTGGDITISADDMVINDPISAAGTVTSGIVTLRPVTTGRAIDLGTNAANTLGLTDAEIDGITAGVIVVGSSNAGALTVTAAISPANSNTLFLKSGASITDAAAGALLVPNLAAQAGTGVTLDNAANTFANLEAQTDTGGITIDHSGALTIGGVTADLTGLAVNTSGNINVTNAGSIILADTDGFENVRGGNTSGNVTLVSWN
jgi:hypothetical protein